MSALLGLCYIIAETGYDVQDGRNVLWLHWSDSALRFLLSYISFQGRRSCSVSNMHKFVGVGTLPCRLWE